jgi:DNA polymerase-4
VTTGTADWVLHVDLDQFLAAVEVLRRPELAGRPVVVGGDGNPARPRQVVATASYEARAHGVRSGMPLRTAARRCPDAVFLPSDKPAYEAASIQVADTLRTLPVVVEEIGWDEWFLGATTDDPEALARQVIERVRSETRLTSAIGIGQSRLQAKTATGFAKAAAGPTSPTPRVAVLRADEWLPVMGERPVTAIWGIGERIAARLADAGITTVNDLAVADHHDLAIRFGPTIGPNLKLMGMGGHTDPIRDDPHVAKGRSKEETFTRDLTDPAEQADAVCRLGREVTESVVAEGRTVTHVSVKVRTSTFWTSNKIRKLPEPTTDPEVVASRACDLLRAFELTRPVRLLGVRVVLADPEPPA